MPYIPEQARRELRSNKRAPETDGELNYALTALVNAYIQREGLSYGTIADVLSSFDGASKEFYRRVAAPYEDEKLRINGDVYTFEDESKQQQCHHTFKTDAYSLTAEGKYAYSCQNRCGYVLLKETHFHVL